MKLPPFIGRYIVEIVLIVSSVLVTASSFYFYTLHISSITPLEQDVFGIEHADSIFYYVDVSGAVLNPDVYEVTPGARLKDVIDSAGGFSEDADIAFVGRNVNLARKVADEEKIYVPFITDIQNGFVSEISIQIQPTTPISNSSLHLISINDAGMDELDSLPGIGSVSAQKIIDNRPYSAIENLLEKKIVSNSTFEKIHEFISL